MKPTKYSEKVLDHFRNPRNVGILEGDDVAVGRVGNPVCGDLMEIYIKVKDDLIEEMKFKTFGCGSAIATASMITELAKGKSLDEALKITRGDVADELDGLPPIKMHCSNLAADALRDAIRNFREKRTGRAEAEAAAAAPAMDIAGENEFLGKGVYLNADDPSVFRDSRVIVADTGGKSMETAVELAEVSPRVVFATPRKEISSPADTAKKLKRSPVKILYESRIAEIRGMKEVERVLIHDLNEDEEYELFVDSVLLLR